jgi:hypothetical protein
MGRALVSESHGSYYLYLGDCHRAISQLWNLNGHWCPAPYHVHVYHNTRSETELRDN